MDQCIEKNDDLILSFIDSLTSLDSLLNNQMDFEELKGKLANLYLVWISVSELCGYDIIYTKLVNLKDAENLAQVVIQYGMNLTKLGILSSQVVLDGLTRDFLKVGETSGKILELLLGLS